MGASNSSNRESIISTSNSTSTSTSTSTLPLQGKELSKEPVKRSLPPNHPPISSSSGAKYPACKYPRYHIIY